MRRGLLLFRDVSMPVVVSLRPNAQDAAPQYAGEWWVFFVDQAFASSATTRPHEAPVKRARETHDSGCSCLWLVGHEGLDKNIEATISGLGFTEWKE